MAINHGQQILSEHKRTNFEKQNLFQIVSKFKSMKKYTLTYQIEMSVIMADDEKQNVAADCGAQVILNAVTPPHFVEPHVVEHKISHP